MLPQCRLVEFLKEVSQDSSTGLAIVADSALRIIRDAHQSHLASVDVHCLGDLIEEIIREGFDVVRDYLHSDAPDCAICAAIAERIK